MLVIGFSYAGRKLVNDGGGVRDGDFFDISRGELQFVLRGKLIVARAVVTEAGHLLTHLIIVSRGED